MHTEIAGKFHRFAERECKGTSLLYETLANRVAADEELLTLAGATREGQPIPNMLFGAVHFLLLQGYAHSLKKYYPSIVSEPRPAREAFSVFKAFCLSFEDEIKELLQSKLVQTNEVRRCSYLMPIFSYIYKLVKTPLACIEIGTSAGLQLLWDQYKYQYNDAEVMGTLDSEVLITANITAGELPKLAEEIPVSDRIGIDLHVNDLKDEADLSWLMALIWPEHQERKRLFEAAAKVVKENNLRLIEGDGVGLLPDLVEEVSPEATLCVFHTHVANQIPVELKHKLIESIEQIAGKRNIFHIYNNMWDLDVHVDGYLAGAKREYLTLETSGHGDKFTWTEK